MAARKKKKKKLKQKKQALVAKAQSSKADKKKANKDKGRERYELERILQSIQNNKEKEAIERLDRLWGIEKGLFPSRRITWLLTHWSAQAYRDIQTLEDKVFAKEEFTLFLCDHILGLPDDVWSLLVDRDIPQREEGEVLRKAFDKLSIDEFEEAKEMLRKIGLRSPFRDVRMFLRGLSSYYQEDDVEALKAFQRLPEDGVYAKMAYPLAFLLEGGTSNLIAKVGKKKAHDELLSQQFLTLLSMWGLRRLADSFLFAETMSLVKAKKLNSSLRSLSQRWKSFSHSFQTLLYYDFPSLMHSFGLSGEDVVSRFQKAISLPSFDPKGHRIGAVIAEKKGFFTEAQLNWIHLSNEFMQSEYDGRLEGMSLFNASLSVFQEQEKKTYFEDDSFSLDCDCPRCRYVASQRFEIMEENLSSAIDCYPEYVKSWRLLYRIYRVQKKKKQANKLLERATKELPDNFDILLLASEAAKERKAYDKAKKYLLRATKLNPFMSELKEKEAELIHLKAQKKFMENKWEVSHKLYESIEYPISSIEKKVELDAELATCHVLIRNRKEAVRIYEESECRHLMPWYWRLLTSVKLVELGEPLHKQMKKEGVSQRRSSLPKAMKSPIMSPISKREVELYLELYRKSIKGKKYPKAVDELLEKAMMDGLEHLEEKQDLATALLMLDDGENQLLLLERASRLHPDLFIFTKARYELALMLEKKPSYFNTAISELTELRGEDRFRPLSEAFPFLPPGLDADDLEELPPGLRDLMEEAIFSPDAPPGLQSILENEDYRAANELIGAIEDYILNSPLMEE